MNTRTLFLIGWLATISLSLAQSPSTKTAPGDSPDWQQLIRQGPKAAADLDEEGDKLADAGHDAEAAARYESWRDLPEATPEQKALATIKLAQLAEAQSVTEQARDLYLKALSTAPPASSIAHEVRLRIEDSFRRGWDLPGLIAVWQNYLPSHGNDPEVGLLLANALAELRRAGETANWPQKDTSKAIASAPAKAPDLGVALAVFRAGHLDEERDTLMAAFDAQSDPLQRLEITGRLAQAFARTGRFDELVAHFRAKSRTEKDGWRYAVYLAEIWRSEQDDIAARTELARAFGPRSRDVLFLTESWRLNVGIATEPERARLARLLAQVDPSPARDRELIIALLRAGETPDAAQGLQANAEVVFADPMQWHDVFLVAGAADLGQTVAKLLETGLARHPDDWRLRFLLAETYLRTGDFALAEKYFREIEAAAPATREAGEKEGDAIFSAGVVYDSETGHGLAAAFARRNRHGYGYRQILKQIAEGLNGATSSSAGRVNLPHFDISLGRYLPQTLADAADAALVMRSVLAQQQGHGAEFVTELQGVLAKLPRAERIARLSLVQAMDPLLQELTAESIAPSGDEMTHAACLEVSLCLSMGNTGVPVDRLNLEPAVLISLLKAFLPAEKNPQTLVRGKMELSRLLKQAGEEKEAHEVAEDALAHWTVFPPQDKASLLFFFALDNRDADRAEVILSAMAAVQKRASFYNERIKLASLIAEQKKDDPRILKLLVDALRDSYPSASSDFSQRSMWRARSVLREAQRFPYGCRLIGTASTYSWPAIFDLANRLGQLDKLHAALVQQTSELPAGLRLYPDLASICFSWWANDHDTAIREVLGLTAAHQDDELKLLAGSMLASAGRNSEAQKIFEQVSASDGDVARDKVVRLLELARVEKNVERSKALALQLLQFPLPNEDQNSFQGILKECGLAEQAANLRSKEQTRTEGFFYAGQRAAVQQLQRESQANHQREAAELARVILAHGSPGGDDYSRQNAIDMLRRAHALTDYTDELNRQLAADPKSTETLLRLAEAFERSDVKQAADFYRRAIELNPEKISLQLRLATMLANHRQTAEAVQTWESAFARDPHAVFSRNFASIFSAYRQAKQLSLLSNVLLKAAPRQPLETLNFDTLGTTIGYEEVAEAMRKDGQSAAAIQLWQALLEREKTSYGTPTNEFRTLQALVPVLLEAGRKDEAVQAIENYFYPATAARPPLGYEVGQILKNWTQVEFGMAGHQEVRGVAMLRLAQSADALDRLRARALTAANTHPESPDRLLVLLIDGLRHDPAQLEPMRKEFDAVIASTQSPADATNRPSNVQVAGPLGKMNLLMPWSPTTGYILHSVAQELAEWPEGRPLALHIYEKTPQSAGSLEGWDQLQRAEIALSIPDKEAAQRALHEWLSGSKGLAGVLIQGDIIQQLSAVDLLSRADMSTEASSILQKIQTTGDLQNRPDLKKRAEELTNRLTPHRTEDK